MSDHPLLSIIIPVYKVEKYLPECIESVLNQTCQDYELILVDDGSPDNCPRICDDYAARYPKIKVIHKSNGGLSDARNVGTNIASGKYLTYLDSDDYWETNDVVQRLEQLSQEFPDTDVFLSDFILYYDQTGNKVIPNILDSQRTNNLSKADFLNYLFYELGDLKCSASQKIVRRELLQDIKFKRGLLSEDIDWTLQLYPKVNNIKSFGIPYYVYRQLRSGSITNTVSSKSVESILYIIEKWRKILDSYNLSTIEKQIYMGYLAYQLSICILQFSKVAKDKKKKIHRQIKDNLDLFEGNLNFKTIKIRKMLKFTSIPVLSWILSIFYQIRQLVRLNQQAFNRSFIR